jgi:ABC-type phosphate transport system substrate-binding protein
MKTYKTLLLTATSAAGLMCAAGASAATTLAVYPAAEIHGNGASSIIVDLNKSLQCLGNPDAPIGFGADGSTKSFTPHLYKPISPTTSNPIYDCSTQSIQGNLTGHYVSTGSGGGKTNWSKFNLSGIAVMPASFTSAYADNHVQFAFSDSPISSTNLSDYTTNAAPNGTGPAIQVPAYVLPIAVVYAPVYGKIRKADGVHELALNNHFPVKVTYNGSPLVTGGLRLKKTTYCAIMNGTITNWNDPALKADNGNISLMDANDDVTRWNSTGVPIKLVGRNDNSGTTNLFTRAMTAQCGGDYTAGGTDQLPTARKGTARYDKATGALTSGTETAGLFGLVDGSDGIADTVGQTLADPVNVGDVVLGGYAGYVGSDFVRPAIVGGSTPVLYAAALQGGSLAPTTYYMPTPTNAGLSFTGYLPPQSNTNGTYNPTSPAPGSSGNRNNPLDWVLPATATTGLANPGKGYPIVGTTNLLLYTCYNSYQKRAAVVAMAALQFGKLTSSDGGAANPFNPALATSTGKGADGLPLGILARNGLANVPAAWKTALWETFFTKVTSGNNPSQLNLWIQDKLPTTSALIDGNTANGEVKQNTAVCTAGQGA